MREERLLRPLPEEAPTRPQLTRKSIQDRASALKRIADAREAHSIDPAPYRPVPQPKPRRLLIGALVAGTLAALLVPLYVLYQQNQKAEAEMKEAATASTVLVCTSGKASSMRSNNLWEWLTSGPKFTCTDWETPEGRSQRVEQQKERDRRARDAYLRESRGW